MNIESFNKRWVPEPFSGCWLWIGAISEGRTSYGQVQQNNKKTTAHRVSWELHKGNIPAGLFVLHQCDTGLCVNPEHLFLGTAQDNSADMKNKNRSYHPRGESNGRSKLSVADVTAIRRLAPVMRQVDIARRFDVSRQIINHIVKGNRWNQIN